MLRGVSELHAPVLSSAPGADQHEGIPVQNA